MDAAQIEKLFKVHPPKNVRQMERKQEIREAALVYAQLLGRLLSNSPERILAIRDAQRSMQMAFSAIDNE
jgi:hypothetical protein